MCRVVIAALLSAQVLLVGCRTPEVRPFRYNAVRLTDDEAAQRIVMIDSHYGPPRTVTRVSQSLTICLGSLGPSTVDDVLWRASRSCAWLAQYAHEDHRTAYAQKGVATGREAVRENPDGVEGAYFLALNLGILSQLYSSPGHVDEMHLLLKRCIELDESFDYAAPHRFLGMLYESTEGQPGVHIGTLDDALRHLRRACDLAPNYPRNHLLLAQALIEDDQIEAAREHLREVMRLPPPPGEESAAVAWRQQAETLLRRPGL